MKNTAQILNLLLASALVLLAIKFTLLTPKTESKEMENSAYQTIMSRTSIRLYSQKSVDNQSIEKILRAAMAAPTAGNKQPWAFIVITDKDILQRLSEKLPYAKMIARAPLAIVACGDLSKAFEGTEADYWVQDVSAASENILLAAHYMGLGGVWTGVYPIQERVNDVSEVLSLPSNIIPLSVIPIGHPEGEIPETKDKWKPDNIHYNKW